MTQRERRFWWVLWTIWAVGLLAIPTIVVVQLT